MRLKESDRVRRFWAVCVLRNGVQERRRPRRSEVVEGMFSTSDQGYDWTHQAYITGGELPAGRGLVVAEVMGRNGADTATVDGA